MFRNIHENTAKATPYIIIIVVCLAYCNSLTNEFVYDDKYFIVDNTWIRSMSFLPRYFTDPGNTVASHPWPGIYRPLRTLSYAGDYLLWGTNPFGYHLTNLLLHCLNTLLFYRVLRYFFSGSIPVLAGSLIFGTHPVQTESVTWLSSRAELLYTLFCLLAIVLVIMIDHHSRVDSPPLRKSRAHLFYIGIYVCFAFALLSKETSVILPFLIFAIWHLLSPGQSGVLTLLKIKYRFWVTLFMILFLYLVLRFSFFETIGQQPYWGGSLATNLFTSAKTFMHYLQVIIFPVSLTVDHRVSVVQSPFDPFFASGFLTISLLIYFCAAGLRRKKLWALGLFWYMSALLPVSNIIPIKALMAERFLYFPLCGIIILVCDIVTTRVRRAPLSKILAYFIFLVLLPLFIWGTIDRNIKWHDGISLWSDAIKQNPSNSRAYFGYGFALETRGKNQEALNKYKKSIDLDPGHAEPYFRLGYIYESMNQYNLALESYGKSYLINKANPELLYNMGNVYMAMSKNVEANRLYDEALSVFPNYVMAYNNKGLVLERSGDIEGARAAFEKAISINPSFIMAYNNLGILFARNKMFQDAKLIFEKALTVDPGNQHIRRNLRILYEDALEYRKQHE